MQIRYEYSGRNHNFLRVVDPQPSVVRYLWYRDGLFLRDGVQPWISDSGFLVPNETYEYACEAVDIDANVIARSWPIECTFPQPERPKSELRVQVIRCMFSDWTGAMRLPSTIINELERVHAFWNQYNLSVRWEANDSPFHIGPAADYCTFTLTQEGWGDLWYGPKIGAWDKLRQVAPPTDGYDLYMYIIEGFGAVGYSGNPYSYYSAAWFNSESIAHEWGHAFGAHHAGGLYWQPDSNIDALRPRIETTRYADPYCLMGGALELVPFSRWHAHCMGLLDARFDHFNGEGSYPLTDSIVKIPAISQYAKCFWYLERGPDSEVIMRLHADRWSQVQTDADTLYLGKAELGEWISLPDQDLHVFNQTSDTVYISPSVVIEPEPEPDPQPEPHTNPHGKAVGPKWNR